MLDTTTTAGEQAAKWRKEGSSYAEIAKKLAEAGFKSRKTKKPFTDQGVQYLINKSGTTTKKKFAKKAARRAPQAKAASVKAKPTTFVATSFTDVRKILELKSLPADQRIELALMVLPQ